jgi:acetoin utilization protein AcuB
MQFRHLLVTDEDGRLAGIVSDRDVVRCFGPTAFPDEAQLAAIRADSIMSPDVVTIEFDSSIVAAIDLMHEQGFSSLPVLHDGRLVGIITTSDLMRLLRRLLSA